MKSIGITRKIDELGRITLPIELRRTLDIEVGQSMEIYVEGERIILTKYQNRNVCKCGSTENVTNIHGVACCQKCLEEALSSIKGKR
ncbi:MAG TPA: AbrB/MazE/SpoVT family DNA-binding domain-containing protein, partial [Lachnospiraceae bacterium]|jgi:transcriptional pleiotropic regulator of transition state genes|nr:AbrB/MazE/SpoVT family DNA-binding domain-containing protein [Lachnospiraceae bacterium]